jgi:prenylcysteine oxidase/farnesylcysteine lyase
MPVSITIFEKEPRVGGRAAIINVYDDINEPVEIGAAIIIPRNEILVNATKDLNVETEPVETWVNDKTDTMGIFNGINIVFSICKNKWGIFSRLFHRYRAAEPMASEKLAEDTVSKILAMYKEPIFPFKKLSEATFNAGLEPLVRVTAQQFLTNNGIDGTGIFACEVIQASTRAAYSQNLGRATGLQAMASLSNHDAISVKGGNWKLFQAMIDASNTELRLNTSVTSISRSEDGVWTVKSKIDEDHKTEEETYDSIIITGPLQRMNITIHPKIDKQPTVKDYAIVHVTLFTSPKKLNPKYFGRTANESVPGIVMTALGKKECKDWRIMMATGKEGVGSAGFYYMSSLREMKRPHLGGSRTEYLYKVFSPEYFGDDKIKAIISNPKNKEEVKDDENKDEKDAITWIYRHVWEGAYPQEGPKMVFDETKIANGLWYTAGMETVISTMETSSLMGMNVAKLIVEDWGGWVVV